MHRNWIIIFSSMFIGMFLFAASSATAQEKGAVTIQGKKIEKEKTTTFTSTSAVLDFREQMRYFVQRISVYARSFNPNFIIIAQNGTELLVKRDVSNPEKTSPANTYMRSIDAILQEGLFFTFSKPRPKEKQQDLLKNIKMAKDEGLKVLVVDYTKNQKMIDESYRINGAKNYISFAAHKEIEFINSLPPYPKRPFHENSKSILSMNDVKNFLVLGNTAAFGREDEFAMKIHATNYDMVVVDIFHGRRPLSKRAVETLKFKKVGGRRLVLAHIDIGSAASYHYYWQPQWQEGSPPWITAPQRHNPDKYHVKYWQPEWQQIIAGDTKSYIYGLIDQGYDGVVLNGVDAFAFFEGSGQSDEEN